MFPLGFSGGDTGSGNGLICDSGMTLGGDGDLCCEYGAANGAMLSFGFSRGGAGGRQSSVRYFRMTQGGKDGLCREDLFTKGASLSFGQACGDTSRRDGRQLDGFFVFAIEYPYEATHVAAFVPIAVKGMVDERDFGLGQKYGVADETVLAIR